MKCLVTGGAGFIGSHVAEACLAAGHEVLVVDDLSSGHLRNLPAGAAFRELDIRSDAFGDAVRDFRPQAVFHLAAQMDVRKSVADPVLDASINVLGTVRLLQAATQAGTDKVIFSSTGGAIYGEQDYFPATEQHPCRPVSPYGTSKLCAENYLRLFARSGGPTCVALRYANVYGPRQDPHGEAGVVAIFARKMLSGQTPVINGDGKQTRDFVFVTDVARANLLALKTDVDGEINIGTGIENDINTIAEILLKHTGFSGSLPHGPAMPGEQSRSSIDPSRAEEILGWKAQIELDNGLRETVEYFRLNPEES
jgi:UDP-glucose 4-epimerase